MQFGAGMHHFWNKAMFLKLRESLTHHTDKPIVPQGIAVFPRNALWFVLMIVASVLVLVGLSAIVLELDVKNKPGRN
jgi:hypothetical protein